MRQTTYQNLRPRDSRRMKRNSFNILFLTVLFLGLFQNCIDLNRDRVYYDKYFHIYISVKQESGYCDIRLGKSLSNLDNKLLFSNISEMAIFSIIPKNDTIYIYDEDYWVTETSNGSLILKKSIGVRKTQHFLKVSGVI